LKITTITTITPRGYGDSDKKSHRADQLACIFKFIQKKLKTYKLPQNLALKHEHNAALSTKH